MPTRIPAALFAALVLASAAPLTAAGAIEVEPPTGSADPSLLEELRVSVENVASGAAATYGVGGRIRLNLDSTGEEVSITLELVPDGGAEPVAETRVASRTAAAAEVRAMARAAIRAAAGSRAATASPNIGNEEVPAPAAGPYDEKKLLTASLLVTVPGALAGAGLTIGAQFSFAGALGLGIAGGIIGGSSLALGPAIGHLWVRNNLQGALGLVGRLALAGSATALLTASTMVGFFGTWGSGCEEGDDCDQEIAEDNRTKRIYIGVGVGLEVAAVAWAIIDLATLPRAVRRANEAAPRPDSGKAISDVVVVPVVAPGPGGEAISGLALSMRF